MSSKRPPIGSGRFRQLCGQFTTGVAVVTTTDDKGKPAGMTANSFTSVSLNPPLVSVNVDRSSDFHPVISRAATFVINVLASDQEDLSRRFAGPAAERFEGIGYQPLADGSIQLEGVLATIECVRHLVFDIGDHTVVVGLVVGGHARDGRPLLFFRGGYHPIG